MNFETEGNPLFYLFSGRSGGIILITKKVIKTWKKKKSRCVNTV